MKQSLRCVFWPILKYFESPDPALNYKKSHRIALNVLGALFVVLSLGSLYAVIQSAQLGGLIPVIVFFCVGLVALVVGGLGSEQAVSRIWGNR